MKKYLKVIAVMAVAVGMVAFAATAKAVTVAHYDFSDGSGTTLTNMGTGGDGTLLNFADTSAGAGVFDTSEGWVTGGGLSFQNNGNNAHVDTGILANSFNGPVDLTFEFLFNQGTVGGIGAILASSGDAGFALNTAAFLGVQGANFHVRMPDTDGTVIAGSTGPHSLGVGPNATTVHVAVVLDDAAGTAATYVDGVVVHTQSGVDGPSGQHWNTVSATDTLLIGLPGWAGGGEAYAGVLSGLAISTDVLDSGSFVLAIPEPSSLALLTLGLVGLGSRRRR